MATLKFNLKINNASRKAVVKRMKNSIKIPVEYTIYTTSDWTQFEIVEGGHWQDQKIEYIEGEDDVIKEEFTNKKLYLEKDSEDNSPVVLRMTCVLNINKAVKQSKIKYSILKGDIQSTVVTVNVNKKLFMSLVNTKTDDFWRGENQQDFYCTVSEYLNLRKIFIIHGRDELQVLRLKNFLKDHKIGVVTLDDLRNDGKTIFQKLYDELNNITYAIAILTPDDVGCLKEDTRAIIAEKNVTAQETVDKLLPLLQGRARQNVLFELGLFIGALGKENICYLKQKDLKELPSDLHGALYVEFKENVDETFHKLIDELFPTD